MDHLPFEILREIHLWLPPSDTKAFRLVSKLAAAAGTEFLIPTLSFNLTKESLQRLEEVSGHPVISRHVRKIFYGFASLKIYDNMKWFKRDLIYSRLMDGRLSTGKVESLYTSYNEIVSEQTKIKSGDSDIKIITQAISRLPNLDTLLVETSSWGPSHLHHSLTKAFENAPELQRTRAVVDADQVRQLASLMVPIAMNNIRIKEFQLRCINPKAFIQSPDTFRHMCKAFSSAVEAHIGFNHEPCEDVMCDSCIENLQTPQLHNFLKSATGLEILILDLQTDEIWAKIDLTHVFGTFSWSALRSLTLTGLRATENELIDFLSRHTTTLRDIDMTFVWLKSGSWVTAVQRMKDSLALTCATFNCAIGTEDGRENWDPDEMDAWTRDLDDPRMLRCETLSYCLNFFICRGDERDKNPFNNIEPDPFG